MLKLNVPTVALPTVTVKFPGGVNGEGAIVHVPGAPVVQESVTAAPYPFTAVSDPFQVTF